MRQVPTSCAVCGWRLGLGVPGSAVPCIHRGCWVTSQAIHGDFEAASAGLAVVGIFALLAVLFAVLLAVILGRSTA